MTLPHGWTNRRFDHLGELCSGSTPSSSRTEFWDGATVWVTPTDLSRLNTPYLHDSAKHITERGLRNCSARLLPPGSIVLSSRAPIGYVAIPTVPFCTNQGCKSIALHNSYHSKFVYYAVTAAVPRLKRLGEGTTFAEISKSSLAKAEVVLPIDKAEQAKIADVLSTVDRAIEQTEALIAKQQRIETGLMQDLLTRGIDEHGNLRSEQTHEFKDSRLGRIPIEWDVRSMSELTTQIVDGVHHTPTYTSSGVPFIVVSDLTSGIGIDFDHTRLVSEAAHREYAKRVEPRSGDVLVSKDGTLGVARIVPDGAPRFSIFVSVALLRPKHRLCIADLLWSFFESGEFYWQLGALSAGTGLAHIHLEHFRQFQLRCPRVDEQRRIFAVITAQSRLLTEYTDALQKLRSVRSALMQDLLTGKRRVTPLLEQCEGVTT